MEVTERTIAATKSGAARHFPALVGGTEVETDRITYGLDVAALLDPDGGQDLWRRLLSGDPDVADHPHVTGSVAVCDEPLIQRATEAAAAAAPAWRRVPLDRRMGVLGEVRHRLLARRAELTELMMAEGCPRTVADWQIAVAANGLDDRSAAWMRSQMLQEIELDRRRIRLVRRPDGVVGFNPPRNAAAGNAILCAPVLAAGNAVILRIPRSVPVALAYLADEILQPALEACDAPPGTLNVLCAEQPPTMQHWVDSPLVDTVFHMGASESGLAVERRCVATGTKPVLELSGNDAGVVWRDADLDLAADALGEAFLASGQICMAPNHVVVHPVIADDLVGRLVDVARAQRAGDPREAGVTLSPLFRAAAFTPLVDEAMRGGATLVCGGRRIGADNQPADRGLFAEPTVLRIDGLEVAATHRVVREETFFPLLTVVVPEAEDDSALLDAMIRFLGANRYGLRTSLWARDPSVIDAFVSGVTDCGNLKVNDSHLGSPPVAPTHGGPGRTGGAWGEANYPMLRTSRLQAVTFGPGDEAPSEVRRRIW